MIGRVAAAAAVVAGGEREAGRAGLGGLLISENGCLVSKTIRISARRASISWVMRTRLSWVSSQKASRRSVKVSTGSSRSGVGLDRASSEIGYGDGG